MGANFADIARAAAERAPANWLLLAMGGSRAYGFANADSDYDWLGVYVMPLRELLDVRRVRAARTAVRSEPDLQCHELGHFCHLAAKGNPSVADALWSPSIMWPRRILCETWGKELVGIRRSFLHKGCLNAYFGYYSAQAARFRKGRPLHTTGGQYNPKWGVHMIRLMMQAEHLAKTGDVLVRLPPEHAALLKAMRGGGYAPEVLMQTAEEWRERASEAETATNLPDAPEWERINSVVLRARLDFWGEERKGDA